MITRKGTSIIEIIIATALISVAIIAALSLINHSQKQNTYARDLAEATKYATQAADWIRTQRNTLGFATLYTLGATTYCLNDFPTDFTQMLAGSCDSTSYIPNTTFQREITLTKPNLTTLKFIIVTSWKEQITRQATIEMELTKW